MRPAESRQVFEGVLSALANWLQVMNLNPSGLIASLTIGKCMLASSLISKVDLMKKARGNPRASFAELEERGPHLGGLELRGSSGFQRVGNSGGSSWPKRFGWLR
jgi:hypothetical protein